VKEAAYRGGQLIVIGRQFAGLGIDQVNARPPITLSEKLV